LIPSSAKASAAFSASFEGDPGADDQHAVVVRRADLRYFVHIVE
jgi:hypothetical protein